MRRFRSNGISFRSGSWPLDKKKPMLFFIHGAGQSSLFWENQLAGLLRSANTIALDLPGHGNSHSQSKFPSKIENYAKSVTDLLAVTKPIFPIICGLSMGGAIAQYLLLTEPSLFKAAVLINTGAKLKVLPRIMDTIKLDYSEYLETFVKMSMAKRNRVKTMIHKIITYSSASLKVTINDFIICNNFDVMKTVNLIKVPTLVMTATEDLLTPPKYGYYLADQIPQSMHVSIDEAGHMSPIENPHAVNNAIINFINSLTKSIKL